MIRLLFRLLQLLIVVGLVIFFLSLFRPTFINNAGNALLKSVGSSNAYGSAQVVPSLQGNSSNLQLNLQGLDSNAHYVVTLQQGSCSGKVLLTIGNVSSDNNGSAASNFSLADLSTLAQQGVWVNVHAGNSASGPSVACGEIQINSTAATKVEDLTASDGSTTNTTVITSANDNYGLNPFASQSATNTTGSFPQTGVAPAKSGSYDNYKFPRKY